MVSASTGKKCRLTKKKKGENSKQLIWKRRRRRKEYIAMANKCELRCWMKFYSIFLFLIYWIHFGIIFRLPIAKWAWKLLFIYSMCINLFPFPFLFSMSMLHLIIIKPKVLESIQIIPLCGNSPMISNERSLFWDFFLFHSFISSECLCMQHFLSSIQFFSTVSVAFGNFFVKFRW